MLPEDRKLLLKESIERVDKALHDQKMLLWYDWVSAVTYNLHDNLVAEAA